MKSGLFNRHSKILICLAAFVLVFAIALFVFLQTGLGEKTARLEEVQRELADMELENEKLDRMINNEDRAELYEYRARERGYVYPDEKVFFDITPGE